jgi:hypothetical protein
MQHPRMTISQVTQTTQRILLLILHLLEYGREEYGRWGWMSLPQGISTHIDELDISSAATFGH